MPENLATKQRRQLTDGLRDLTIELSAEQCDKILHYLHLLIIWNQAYNLTAVRNSLEHVSRHILDSLSVIPHVSGSIFLDVGTGAGLPGVPLSIALPEKQWYLLDSNGKRTRFLTQCVIELKLKNVTVVHSRIENWLPPVTIDGIISRAFSSLGSMVQVCDRIAGPGTVIFAMKAHVEEEEQTSLPEGYMIDGTHSLKIPGSEARRQLVVIKRSEI